MTIIIIIDLNTDVVDACREAFADTDVRVEHGDIFSVPTVAYVSPANGQGLMVGGIDAVYARRWPDVAARVREAAVEAGGFAVGTCEAFPIPDMSLVATLLVAPTMDLPGTSIFGTSNVYLAMRAILRQCRELELGSVNVPGLGTGIGGMPHVLAARQMRMAFDAES